MEARVFKWSCLGIATVFAAVLLYLANDMRNELARTNAMVDEHLPQILANMKTITSTLADVSKDVQSFRNLAGLVDAPSDKSLVAYADSVLDFLEQQPAGKIGLAKLVGSGMKDVADASQWARDSRKEALWLTLRASTKAELLDRLSKNKFGSDWMYFAPGIDPMPLRDFLRLNHPESKGL